jgi:hypothetical protein
MKRQLKDFAASSERKGFALAMAVLVIVSGVVPASAQDKAGAAPAKRRGTFRRAAPHPV